MRNRGGVGGSSRLRGFWRYGVGAGSYAGQDHAAETVRGLLLRNVRSGHTVKNRGVLGIMEPNGRSSGPCGRRRLCAVLSYNNIIFLHPPVVRAYMCSARVFFLVRSRPPQIGHLWEIPTSFSSRLQGTKMNYCSPNIQRYCRVRTCTRTAVFILIVTGCVYIHLGTPNGQRFFVRRRFRTVRTS